MCSVPHYPRLRLGLALASVLIGGQASAQVAANCPNYLAGDTTNGAYCINGSDTLFDVITQSIKNKVAKDKAVVGTAGQIAPIILQGTTAPASSKSALYYNGGGSGNAEKSMQFGATGAGGLIGGGGLGSQSIGGMSRNFRPSVVTAFPSWQPQIQNVLGLDAAVIVVPNTTTHFKNFSLPLLPTDSTKANPNNPSQPITFGTQGSGYTQMLEVILSGIDGSGSTAACSDQRRVQAVADFSALNGVPLITHFYRRDENSGTTDTFKDKVAVGRFCNGNAVGVAGSNTTNANLNNQDLDPIRRPCDAATATRRAVACTDLTTGLACTAGAANCTQGLVTALSELDPGSDDITNSIAARVGSDTTGATVGYAGREAAKPAVGSTGAFINTNPFSNALVRGDVYMLSRRLYLQRGPAVPSLDASVNPGGTYTKSNSTGACSAPAGSTCTEKVNDLNATSNTAIKCPQLTTNACAGGGSTQQAFEDALFNYMTDPGGSGSQDGAPGRCNTDPVVRQFGFLSCIDDCTLAISDPSNLCAKTPFANPAAAPSACLPSSGTWNYGTLTASAAGTCCSNGAAVAAGGTCPAGTGRGLNSACWQNSDCTSNVCADIGGGLTVCQ